MFASCVVLCLTAAPSVAVVDFSKVDVSSELASFAADQVALELAKRGPKVVTSRDVAAVLGLERQRQLLGCSDDGTSCELAQAMGADFLLTGTLARLGSVLQVSLKLIDSRTGRAHSSWQGTVRDEAGLPALLQTGAEALAESLTPPQPKRRLGASFWVPLSVGAALLVGSGVSLGLREDAWVRLGAPASMGLLSSSEAVMFRERGRVTQVAAPVLAGAGALSVGLAFLFFALTPVEAPAVSVLVTGERALLSLGGAF